MRREISPSDDTIDPRDIRSRVEELEEYRDSEDEEDKAAWEKEYEAEHKMWSGVLDEVPIHEVLISDDHFTKYAEQLADDLGYLNGGKAESWPFNHIDWEAAAEALKMDYSSVEIDGNTYWYRSC